MTRTLLASALASSFAAASAGAADTLTVYSGDFEAVSQSEPQAGGPGYALVERRLPVSGSEVSVTGLPRALDASSIVVTPPGGATVRGQRFDFGVAGQDDLLRSALGSTVSVEQAVGDQRQVHTGVLLAAGNGLTLRMPDGRIKVLSSYSGFELGALPAGASTEPTLVVSLSGASRGEMRVDFATAGLAWRAEYVLRVRGQGKACRMDLDGAAMVVNRSGTDFRDASLTLVAGEPNRERGQAMQAPMARMVKAEMMAADGAVAPQASGEYQAYRLPNRGDLPHGSVSRLPLVAPAADVPCERRYETSAMLGDWRPPFPILDENFNAGDGQKQPVQATVRFDNEKSAGLGLPLPAGRVRMFTGNDFLGESAMPHTPAGQDVALVAGNAFDLGAERTRESFQLDRAGRTMTETVKLELSNAKAEAVTIRVNERLGRWTGWEVEDSTVPAQRRDAQTVGFDVPVPAGGKATLRYTVRYRWAADVKIP